MNGIKRLFVVLCILLPSLSGGLHSAAESSRTAEIRRLYVDSFGSSVEAIYLRSKLCFKLAKSGRITVVDDRESADAILSGTATMRLIGHYNSDPRSRYGMGRSVAVYDAKMTVELEDRQGRTIWSGRLKPRFWGSQYVSENVVNQAARQVAHVLR